MGACAVSAPYVIASLPPCPHCGTREALIAADLAVVAIAGSADSGWQCEAHGYMEAAEWPCCHVAALLAGDAAEVTP